MLWRLILLVVICALVITFIGFNIENRSDISLVFMRFENVPIFISLFSAFLMGILVALPFMLISSFKQSLQSSKYKKVIKKKDKGLTEMDKAQDKKSRKKKKEEGPEVLTHEADQGSN